MSPSSDDHRAIKDKVSAAVLKLPGVSGVGMPARGLTIYLEDDSAELRGRVAAAVEKLKVPVTVHWEVTGKFGKF